MVDLENNMVNHIW